MAAPPEIRAEVARMGAEFKAAIEELFEQPLGEALVGRLMQVAVRAFFERQDLGISLLMFLEDAPEAFGSPEHDVLLLSHLHGSGVEELTEWTLRAFPELLSRTHELLPKDLTEKALAEATPQSLPSPESRTSDPLRASLLVVALTEGLVRRVPASQLAPIAVEAFLACARWNEMLVLFVGAGVQPYRQVRRDLRGRRALKALASARQLVDPDLLPAFDEARLGHWE